MSFNVICFGDFFLFFIIIIKNVLEAVEMSAGSCCFFSKSREKEIKIIKIEVKQRIFYMQHLPPRSMGGRIFTKSK